jgi:hypothetical protein
MNVFLFCNHFRYAITELLMPFQHEDSVYNILVKWKDLAGQEEFRPLWKSMVRKFFFFFFFLGGGKGGGLNKVEKYCSRILPFPILTEPALTYPNQYYLFIDYSFHKRSIFGSDDSLINIHMKL